MRVASLSDIHLGFRAFHAQVDGRNLREVDVENAWREAVAQIVAEGVDLVTIAGDVFHHPRVSDFAKRAYLEGLKTLLDSGATVVVIGGNHDFGKTADVLSPLMLGGVLDHDNLHIVTTPKRLHLTLGGGIDVAIACVPYVDRGEEVTYRLDPEPDVVNILLMHAPVQADGELPRFYAGAEAVDIMPMLDQWDAVVLGDYHEFKRLHPEHIAFYSGSLERTSSNIWQETAPKGWVLWEFYGTEPTMEFREVWTRPMVDRSYWDRPADAAGLNEMLASVPDGFAGAMVRLKVADFPREERAHIDWSLVNAVKRECAHFMLDLRYEKSVGSVIGDRRDRVGLSLADEAARFFSDDRGEVRTLAMQYLSAGAAL